MAKEKKESKKIESKPKKDKLYNITKSNGNALLAQEEVIFLF